MSEEKQQEAPAPPPLSRTILNLLPLIIVGLYLCHYSPSKRPGVQLQQCGKHLHEIGVAIEKDRLLSDDKLYNQELKKVFSKNPIPACPAGGKDAYLEGYQVSADRRSYLLVCKGDHHKDAGVPSDYPRIAFSVPESETTTKNSSTPESAEATPEESASPAVVPAVTPSATPTVSTTQGAERAPSVAATPAAETSPTANAQGQDQKHKPEKVTGKKEQEGNKDLSPPAASATPKS